LSQMPNDCSGPHSKSNSIWTEYHAPSGLRPLPRKACVKFAVNLPGLLTNPTPLPAVVAVFSDSHQFNSEDLLAYDLGYRVQATKNLLARLLNFSTTITQTSHRRSRCAFVEVSPAPTPIIVIPFVAGNKMSGGNLRC